MLLDLLLTNKFETDQLIYHQSLTMLMEEGIFSKLVLRIGDYSLSLHHHVNSTLVTLTKFMATQLDSTCIYERSIYYKSLIFENLSLIVRVSCAEDVSDCPKILTYIYLIYTSFVKLVGIEYCRSTMRSHIKDGTIRTMARLLSQHSKDEAFLKLISSSSLYCTELFFQLIEVDKNTVYNKQCNEIVDLLRIIAPTMAKVVLLNWKEKSGAQPRSNSLRALKIIEHYVTVSHEKADRQIFKRIKLSKNLLDLVYWEFTHSCGNQEDFAPLLELSYGILCRMKDIRMESLSPLMPFLIKFMRKITDKRKLSSSEESYILLCTQFSLLFGENCGENQVESYNNILRMKLIPAKVNIMQYFCKSSEPSHLFFIVKFVQNMAGLVQKAAKENLLDLIEQVIPCFPFLVHIINGREDLNLEVEPMPNFSLASLSGKLFHALLMGISFRISDNKIACIKPHLDLIMESGLVSAVGRAILRFNDHENVMNFIRVFTELAYLVDNQKIAKILVTFLPEIMNKAFKLKKFYVKAKNEDNIYHQMITLMRKFPAYIMADLDPCLFIQNNGQLIKPIISPLATVCISDDRMEFPVFSSFVLKDGYHDGGAIADTLRGTWQLLKYHPKMTLDIVNLVFSKSNFMFHVLCNAKGNIELEKVQKFVLDLAASHIDFSEEYSTEFLLHITGFVRDLDIDHNNPICFKLLNACKKFAKSQKHPQLLYNISTFTKTLTKSQTEIGFKNNCSICGLKGIPCKSN